jgi:hypothetical protein
MTDFEARLRAAMAAAAGPAPSGLLEGIRRRHRRHVLRAAAAGAAMVMGVAVVVPVTVHSLQGGNGAPRGVAGGQAGSHATALPRPGPGTAVDDCRNAVGGTLRSDWKRHSVQAGPVWFMLARPGPAGQKLRTSTVTASALPVAVSNGRAAIVTVAPSLAGRFRFLAGFHSGNQPYTLAEGSRALELVGCPAGPTGTGIPPGYAAGLTIWWQGYVTDLRGCIPVDVRIPPATKEIRVTVAAPGCKA